MPDGSIQNRMIEQVTGSTITVTSPFSTSPNKNTIYAIENRNIEGAVEFQIYRVISIEEKNDSEYTITAVIHDTNKYAQVEDTTVAANPRTITTLLKAKPSPSNLTATEKIVVFNNRAVSKIFVAWQPVQGVKEYLLEFQYENDDPERIRVARPSFEIFESRLGTYTFAVKSVNTLGKLSSDISNVTIHTQGKTALPADPTNLTIEPVSEQFVRLRFTQSTDVDVLHGGNVIVRHTPSTGTNAIFTNAIDIIPALAGNISETLVPALTGTYLIKFKDDTGNLSQNAAKISVTEPDSTPHQIILTEREDTDTPPFQGDKVTTFYDSTFDGLVLQGTTFLDDIADFNAIPNFNFAGNDDITTGPISPTGSYEFQNKVDLGGKFNLILKRRLSTFGILTNSTFNSRTAKIDTWTDFDVKQPKM